jgi:hypothetical protein
MKCLSNLCGSKSLFAILFLFVCNAASATTVTIPKDEDLIIGARAIIRGRVLSVASAMDGERIFTYTTIRVQEVLKGQINQRRLVIKEQGGQFGSRGSVIWGTPQFTPNENVLLYLTTRADGSLRVHEMFLGKFEILQDTVTGRQIVKRSAIDENVTVMASQTNLSEATERLELADYTAMVRGKIKATSERSRRFEENNFRNIPLRTEPVEYADIKSRGNIQAQFTFIRPSQPMRWFEPDDSEPIVFKVNAEGAPNAQVLDDISAAMNAWSTVQGCSMRVVNAGATSDCYPHGIGNTMVFNNCDQQFPPAEGCSSIIAIGGVNWESSQTRQINGVTFVKVYQGHISFNPYSACSYDNHCNIQEIATHELGHALGLGHSADPTATMAGTAHFDGRCGSIKQDDIDGIKFMYPATGSSGSALAIYTNANLPTAYLNASYTQAFAAGGGVTPFTWSFVSGALPLGIRFLTSGVITGTPVESGTFTFTIQVQDRINGTVQKTFTLIVGASQPQYDSQFVSQNIPASVAAGQSFSANIKWHNTGSQTWIGSAGIRLASQNPLNNTTWGGDSVNLAGFEIPSGQRLDLTFTAQAPQTPGTYNFQWQLFKEGSGVFGQASANFSITVTGDSTPPAINSPASFEATQNTAFSYQFGAVGGAQPYTWSVAAGSLPQGLTLNATSGLLSGTPTTTGNFAWAVQVADLQSRTSQKSVTMTVYAPAPPPAPLLEITNASLPSVTVNTTYNAQLTATGGVSPYVWSIAGGVLPTGVSLNTTTGAISGTPTTIGNFSFTAQVVDSQSHTSQKPFTVTVNPPPLEITAASLPTVVRGASLNAQLVATGGTQPYLWSIAAGSLPGGLNLNAASGVISGAPTAVGTFNFTAQVNDSQGRTARRDFSITVLPSPLAIERATANFEVMQGLAFSYEVKATGGTPAYNWAVTAGILPTGISLNANTGIVSGIPTISGVYNVTVSVRDQKPDTVSATIQIKVINPETIPLITKASYKAGKRMVQVFGERINQAATLWIDGAQVAAKFSDGILIVKKLPLTSGTHQIVVVNPNGVASQPYILSVE